MPQVVAFVRIHSGVPYSKRFSRSLFVFPSNFPYNFGYAERLRRGICASFAGLNNAVSSLPTRAFCSAGIAFRWFRLVASTLESRSCPRGVASSRR
jgi:hypothetical protein